MTGSRADVDSAMLPGVGVVAEQGIPPGRRVGWLQAASGLGFAVRFSYNGRVAASAGIPVWVLLAVPVIVVMVRFLAGQSGNKTCRAPVPGARWKEPPLSS
jgi:hypothetical protein